MPSKELTCKEGYEYDSKTKKCIPTSVLREIDPSGGVIFDATDKFVDKHPKAGLLTGVGVEKAIRRKASQ